MAVAARWLLALVLFVLIVIWRNVKSLRQCRRRAVLGQSRGSTASDDALAPRAQIDGGLLPRQGSVFEHVEEGLQRNPHGLAVVSLHQASNHLADTLEPTRQFQWVTNPSNDAANTRSAASNTTADCLTITYDQLHRTAAKLALALYRTGAPRHSKMLMLIPNGGEYALLLWCCVLFRMAYVCVDPDVVGISGYSNLRDIVKRIKPSTVVVHSRIQAMAIDIAFDDLDLPPPIRICLQADPSNNHAWMSLPRVMMNARDADTSKVLDWAREHCPDEINSIIFTSGTSGTPKGCPLRVASMCHILQSQSWLIHHENSAGALQTIHNSRGIAAFQTLQTWKAGGACVMINDSGNIQQIAGALRNLDLTFLALSPAMASALKEEHAQTPFPVTSVKTVQVGGDAVTTASLVECSRLFPKARICVNHGMTEGAGSFEWPFFDTQLARIPRFGELCPVGFVAKGTAVRIWNSTRQCLCARGELGQLHLRGDNLLRQYMDNGANESFIEDSQGRWFVPGDTAMMDSQGLVYILGRSKDIISTNEGLVVPVAVETVVQSLIGGQVSVIATQHPRLGQAPIAIVQDLGGFNQSDVIERVMGKLGKLSVPAGIYSLRDIGLERFPVNGSGKVSKQALVLSAQKALSQHYV